MRHQERIGGVEPHELHVYVLHRHQPARSDDAAQLSQDNQ
jgi:hypothetical protein